MDNGYRGYFVSAQDLFDEIYTSLDQFQTTEVSPTGDLLLHFGSAICESFCAAATGRRKTDSRYDHD